MLFNFFNYFLWAECTKENRRGKSGTVRTMPGMYDVVLWSFDRVIISFDRDKIY